MNGVVKRAAGALLVMYAAGAWAQSYDFQIGNIKVEGVQRLEPGTVLTYLPVSVGDQMTEARAQQSIRALYDSGLFENVAFDRGQHADRRMSTERPEIAQLHDQGQQGDRRRQAEEGAEEAGSGAGRAVQALVAGFAAAGAAAPVLRQRLLQR